MKVMLSLLGIRIFNNIYIWGKGFSKDSTFKPNRRDMSNLIFVPEEAPLRMRPRGQGSLPRINS